MSNLFSISISYSNHSYPNHYFITLTYHSFIYLSHKHFLYLLFITYFQSSFIYYPHSNSFIITIINQLYFYL